MESHTKVGTVLIMRGLPGTGKSVLSDLLRLIHPASVVLSSDDFFYNPATDTHSFDKEKIKEAHEWNFERFKKEVEKQTPNIVIDNSNIKKYHYHHYLDYAQRHNYLAAVVTIPHNDVSDKELTERNIHSVTRETIRRMRKEFEWEIG